MLFFFENYSQHVKSSFILNMDLDKPGIVFLFRPFLFISWCYPHGKVPGSDSDVDSESVAFLDKLKLNLSVCHLILLYTVKLICSYCSQYCIAHYHSVVTYAC